ncbi:MAG: acyl-CoA dehydrogenase [Curvibacter sp.]|nr:acyl-CoA dehydrogenase [Curvibacter sp.]
MNYQAPSADQRFLLTQVLQAPHELQALPAFADVDAELMQQVLEESGKFVSEVVAPLNRQGDEIGCHFEQGAVRTPPGFRDAYQAFWQAGWPALSAAPEDGGQGLPAVLEATLYEMLSAANHGWTMAPGLLHGAYECLRHHGSDEVKALFLPRIASGEWLATMCLTEPHAGSDLGLVRTRATPLADGRFALSGSKIFISGGEHDLSDNIVHLVLARLPDAPAGPKGLSLFVVPKFMADGSRSAVVCERIEEKMGLHGSPTCVMRFDDAPAWLVGQPGAGLNAMFVMMNAARLHVALQGIGLLDAAWQKADAYARERRQMRAPGPRPASRGEHDGADLLIEHPAMRRSLEVQRAWIDGGRLLAYRTAVALDVARHHPDAARRDEAQRWCSLVTPVLKAAWTHQAFHGASECLQVFGGHGYVREWGIEQIVRDSRVAMIYEGTNEIQAIDLLVRKVLPDGGEALGALLLSLRSDLDAARAADAEVLRRLAELRYLSTLVVAAARQDAVLPYRVADDYLRALALVLLGWAWARIAAAPGAEGPRWQAPAQALRQRVLPELDLRFALIRGALQDTGATPCAPATGS